MSQTYLLGAGSIGGLLATQLSLTSKTPITLLLNNELRLTNFLTRGSTIRYKNLANPRNPIIQDFQFKAMASVPKLYSGKPQPIQDLIVTTKSHHTLDAIEKVIPSLSSKSNVILVQNGFGVLERIIDQFYSNNSNIPNFYQGVINHGVFKSRPFEINHVGLGDLKVSQIPTLSTSSSSELSEPPSIIKDILHSDILNASFLPYKDLLLFQYEKLIVNCCINPLTAVLDSNNGELLNLFQTETIFNGIIREAVQVLKASAPLDLQSDPTFLRVLDHRRLLSVVLSVAKSTKYNSSSMREDIRHLNNTEIDFINGYIYKKGQQHHVFTPYNKMLMDLVKLKLQLHINRDEQAVKMSL